MKTSSVVEIQSSHLELRSIFKEPVFETWEPNRVALSLYRGLREWGASLENITGSQAPSSAAEIEITAHLFNRRIICAAGLGRASFFVANPNWSEVDLIVKIAKAAMEAIHTSTGATTRTRTVTFGMHIKPQGVALSDVTSKLVNKPALMKSQGKVKAYGISVYGETGFWLVDLSGDYPDCLSIRINRTFDPGADLEEIARALYDDEINLLQMMDLRLQ